MTTPLTLPSDGESGTTWPEKFRAAITAVRNAADTAKAGADAAAVAANAASTSMNNALASVLLLPPKTVNASTYTLVLGDSGVLLEPTIAGPITITIPTNAAVGFPIGTVLNGLIGSSATVITFAGSVTLRATAAVPLSFQGQWAMFKLVKIAANEWVLDHTGVASTTVVTPPVVDPVPVDPTPVDPGPVTPPATGAGRTAISTAAPLYTTGSSYYPVDTTKTTLTGPFPTNAWFMNFMLGSGQQAINVFPYMVKGVGNGLDICIPNLFVPPGNASVLATMLSNFSMRCTQAVTSQKLTGFTDLGATVTWASASGNMAADVVRGMGYVTMRYTGLTPQLVTQNAIIQVNGTAVGATGTFTGTKFKFSLNNGQTWLLYTSSSVTLTMSTANTLVAGSAFTGTFRMALLPATTGSEAALDASATRIPTGGSVDFTVNDAANTATQTFNFASTGTGNLLMYALPHHEGWLSGATYGAPEITQLRGRQRSVLGQTWTLQITMPTVSWHNAGAINTSRLAAINTALATDQSFIPAVGDPYFGGKQLAKAAHLALIADRLGNTNARTTLLNNLKTVMNQYLSGTLPTQLRYDTVWGGIVSSAGLTNQDADFGNGRYNDHHFHYGYAVYTAGVIARYDATWATTWRGKINDLVRDFAEPGRNDPYFTSMRNFDWYEGHSWAAGNFEFGDSRNQESTSEAVNAYYGLYLWGLGSGQSQLRDLGRMLFAEEVKTAQTYWQIKQTDTIYPAAFKTNGVVGVLWANKVDYATFFGGQAEYIHGIQMLPTNPSTEVLVPDAWIQEDWTRILSGLWTRTSVWRAGVTNGGSGYVGANTSPTGQQYTDGLTASGGTGSGLIFNVNITAGRITEAFIVFNAHGTGYTNGETVTLNGSGGSGAQVQIFTTPEDGWKGVLLGAYSQVDPNTAWTMAQSLTSYDDGSSKTQLLTHIASQT